MILTIVFKTAPRVCRDRFAAVKRSVFNNVIRVTRFAGMIAIVACALALSPGDSLG